MRMVLRRMATRHLFDAILQGNATSVCYCAKMHTGKHNDDGDAVNSNRLGGKEAPGCAIEAFEALKVIPCRGSHRRLRRIRSMAAWRGSGGNCRVGLRAGSQS